MRIVRDRPQVTAVLAFFIQTAALLWVIFAVPETLPPAERKPFNMKDPKEVCAQVVLHCPALRSQARRRVERKGGRETVLWANSCVAP